jgi:hypothetical protein
MNVPRLLAAFLIVATPASADAPDVAGPMPTADDRATKDDYVLDTSSTTATLKAGSDGSFSLKIVAKNGKKVHGEAPLEIAFIENATVKPGKAKLGRADLKDKASKEPEVTTTLRGVKAGSTTLEANVSFFLCTDAWCQRMSDRVQVAVTVE